MMARIVARWFAATLMAVAAAMFVVGTSVVAPSQHTSLGFPAPKRECPTGNCAPLAH
jgi:hypothetical protein